MSVDQNNGWKGLSQRESTYIVSLRPAGIHTVTHKRRGELRPPLLLSAASFPLAGGGPTEREGSDGDGNTNGFARWSIERAFIIIIDPLIY